MPTQVKATGSVAVTFTSVDDEVTVFVNGTRAGHSTIVRNTGEPVKFELSLKQGPNDFRVEAKNGPGSAELRGTLTDDDRTIHEYRVGPGSPGAGVFFDETIEIDYRPATTDETGGTMADLDGVFSFGVASKVTGEREIDIDDRGTDLALAVTSKQAVAIPEGWHLVSATLVIDRPDLPKTVTLEPKDRANATDDGTISFALPLDPILAAGVGGSHVTELPGVVVKTGAFASSGGDSAESRRYDVNCRVVCEWRRDALETDSPAMFSFEVAKD